MPYQPLHAVSTTNSPGHLFVPGGTLAAAMTDWPACRPRRLQSQCSFLGLLASVAVQRCVCLQGRLYACKQLAGIARVSPSMASASDAVACMRSQVFWWHSLKHQCRQCSLAWYVGCTSGWHVLIASQHNWGSSERQHLRRTLQDGWWVPVLWAAFIAMHAHRLGAKKRHGTLHARHSCWP